jgi:hypothetical protein
MFSGCSKKEQTCTVTENDGIKTYHNKNIPSDPDFKITPKEVFTIHGYDENIEDSTRMIINLGAVDVDSKGNIFVLDSRRASVKKFDKNGKFIKSFGRIGNGPGESSFAWTLVVLNDSVMIDDYNAFKIVKYDNDGNFIRNIAIKTSGMPERYRRFGKDKIVGYQGYDEMVDEVYYSSYNFTLMNSELVKVKELFEKRIKFDQPSYNFFDIFLSAYAVSDKEIFFAIKSDTQYLIKVFDQNGDYKYSIKRNYTRQIFNETELDEFGVKYKDRWYFNNNKSIYKSAIVQMEYDKYGNLWVFSSIKRDEKNRHDFYVDIFKDGVFINTIKLDICPGYDYVNYDHQIKLINDRLYYINSPEQYVKIFEY